MRTWRRLQQLGAIAVKQAVYVLPDSPAAREDFEWLKTEIEAAGGQATLFTADTVETWSSDELIQEFRRTRENDYATLCRALDCSLAAARRKRAPRRSRQSALRMVETFRQRLAAVEAIDFFASAGRDRAATLIGELQQALAGEPRGDGDRSSGQRARDAYVARTWVTRPRPGIDRMGSAWLIKRFIDPEARFGFVDQPPASGNAIPFDMFGVEFTHHGEWCTFETLVHRFAIADVAVNRLASIVHDLDLKDERFGAPEAAAMGGLVDGLQALYPDDHVLLEQGMTLFEALFRSFERASRPAGPRPLARRRRGASTGTAQE
ncbi:MAG: chromate resistance protein [Acidobacteria bacterium]|nr:chromate resistance protein [Acidobacteriota bacterium]